jgi:hypothetical protein
VGAAVGPHLLAKVELLQLLVSHCSSCKECICWGPVSNSLGVFSGCKFLVGAGGGESAREGACYWCCAGQVLVDAVQHV